MKALIFDKKLQYCDAADPIPGNEEALVQISMAGICNTDIEITKGYMNFAGILGHEFVGKVTECKDRQWVGKRVVGEINIGCGVCDFCRSGLERHCTKRSVLGILNKEGAFAQFLTLPVKNLKMIPDTISDQEAVFVEPLAAACEILEQVHIQPNHRIGVVGDGKLAQLIVQVLLLKGCEIAVFGKHQNKLNLLKFDAVTTLMKIDYRDEMFDVVVEASGSISGFNQAVNLVKPRGILVLKSTTHETIDFDLSKLVINEIQLIGSRCGLFEPAIRLLERKRVHVPPLISAILPFQQWEKGFHLATQPDTLKVVFNMNT